MNIASFFFFNDTIHNTGMPINVSTSPGPKVCKKLTVVRPRRCKRPMEYVLLSLRANPQQKRATKAVFFFKAFIFLLTSSLIRLSNLMKAELLKGF